MRLRPALVALAGLGWWPGMGPSDEARAAFTALAVGWRKLRALGPLPSNVAPQASAWDAYAEAWERGDADLDALPALAADLNVARSYVRDKRPSDPGLDKSHDAVPVDTDRASLLHEAAATVGPAALPAAQAVDRAAAQAAQAAADASRVASSGWTWAAAGAAAVLALIVVAKVGA